MLAFIINALAPTFGAEKDSGKAFKVAVYSYTPAWIAGALQILPALGLLGIIAALYGLYLLYLGLPALMKAPQDKAVAYTAVVVVCAIVLSVVLTGIGGLIVAPAAVGTLGSCFFVRRTGVPSRQCDGKARSTRQKDGGKRR